jgi:hypothetical protein
MNAETITFRSKEDPEFINKHGIDVFIEQQRSERRNQAILDRRKAEHKRRDPKGFAEWERREAEDQALITRLMDPEARADYERETAAMGADRSQGAEVFAALRGLEVPDIEFEPLDDEQELNEQEAEEAMAEGIADHLEQNLNEPTMESTDELPNPKMEDPI